MTARTVVVGGGLSGLICGLLLQDRGVDDVVIVERNGGCGGLLRSVDYGDWGTFDSGTHIFQESLVADVDRHFVAALPEEDWVVLEGNHRDLAGVFLRSKLRAHSPFTDLRDLPRETYRACVADLFVNLTCKHGTPQNALEAAVAKYGPKITELAMAPIMRKLYRCEPSTLHPFALNLFTFPLGRVVMFDTPLAHDLTTSPELRARIAYTDQRELPADRSSGRKTYYPRAGGTQSAIDGLCRRLRERGGEIWTDTQVRAIDTADGRVRAVTLADADGEREVAIADLYWSAGIPPLSMLLGGEKPSIVGDEPLRTAVVNLVLDAPLQLEDLFYVHVVDAPYDTYRVNNYGGYVPRLDGELGYRVGVELFLDDDDLTGGALAAHAMNELRTLGFVPPHAGVLFAKAEAVPHGFPLPTINNMAIVAHHREQIAARQLKNLVPFGVLSQEGVFFMADVLTAMHAQVTA